MRPKVKVVQRPPRIQAEYEGIPPEVWINIFPLLSGKEDIKNVTLTSKSFQTLAQPLLFHHLTFRPQCVTSPTSGHLMSWQGDLARITQRLGFLTLERIGHGVRSIGISPDIKYGRREEGTVELGAIVLVTLHSLKMWLLIQNPQGPGVPEFIFLPISTFPEMLSDHIQPGALKPTPKAILIRGIHGRELPYRHTVGTR